MIVEEFKTTKIVVEATDTSYDLYEVLGDFPAGSLISIQGNAIIVEENE